MNDPATTDTAEFFTWYAELAGHLSSAVRWSELTLEPAEESIRAGWSQHHWSRVVENCDQLATMAGRLAAAAGSAC